MKKFRIIRAGLLCLFLLLTAVLAADLAAEEKELDEEEKLAWLEEHLYLDALSFGVEGTDLEEKIKCWPDWTGGRIYVFLPSYAAGRPLTVEWEYADGVSIDGEKMENGGVWEDYELDREYALCLEDGGTVQESWTAVFLCSQNLPAAFVYTVSGDMDEVDESRENREEGLFCLVNADGALECADGLTYIKGRGNTTWGQDKKPYSIKLRNDHDLLGMGESRRWELLANAYDGSNMRNQLVFEMAQEAGMDYTPQAAWTDLYLNGEYQGIYQISEKVEAGSGRVDIADQEAGQGDLTGGYLFLMEDASRYETAVSKFTTRGQQTMVIKSPEIADEARIEYLSGLVQQFENAIVSPDGTDPETGKDFTELIDLDSFAKKYLVEEIAKNSDAVTNSQYFYKQPDAVSPLLYAGPVWDYDNALGHTNEEAMDPVGLMLDKVRSDDGTSNLWYGSLCSQPVFMERVKELYRDVFAPILETITEERIDEYREYIRVSSTLDWIRWKDTNKDFRYKVCDSYDEYVDYLQEFLRERKDFLDSVWLEGEEYVRIRFVRGDPFGYVDLYAVKGSAGRQAPDSSDIEWEGQRIAGWVYEDGTPYDPAGTVEEDVTVYAVWEPAEGGGE